MEMLSIRSKNIEYTDVVRYEQAKQNNSPFTENYIDIETLKRTVQKVEEQLKNIE